MPTPPAPATTEWVPLWDLNGGTSAGGGGPHHLTHEPGGTDPMVVDAAPTVGSLRTLGTGANQAAPGNAAPTAHHTTHEVGGSDALVNAAWTNQANTFTQAQTINHPSFPQFWLIQSGAPTDQKRWLLTATGSVFYLQVINDAGAVIVNPLVVNRNGNVTVGNNLTVTNTGGNVAIKTAANLFATPQTIGGTSPKLALQDTSQPANAVYFQVWNTAQLFIVDATDDAGTVQARPITANRSGDLTVGRNLIVSGTLQVGKQTIPRSIGGAAPAIQPNMDNWDSVVVNALSGTLSILPPLGTLYDTATLLIRIRDNGTPQALVWDAVYFSGGPSLPTVTVGLKTLHLGFRYNSFYGKWMLIAKSQEP